MHPRTTNNRHKHTMFAALASSPQVRLSSITNTQGASRNRLTYIAFAELVACMSRWITIPLSGVRHADGAIQLHRNNRH